MATDTRHAHPHEHPDKTPEHVLEAGMEHSFPASDPASTTTSQGSRAVPPQDLMHRSGSKPPAPAGEMVAISMPFADQEGAKLALETLVREGPIDRRCAEIATEASGVSLRIQVPRADAERLRAKLERGPGTA